MPEAYNQGMAAAVMPALRALLENVIDYAGLFPPANLPCAATVGNYNVSRSGPHGWMLRWLVVGAPELEGIPGDLDGSLAVLGDRDEPRAAVIESKGIVRAARPVYCEVPYLLGASGPSPLDEVQRAGCFAKLRTGGVKAEAIPAAAAVASFMRDCAKRRLPFKMTAGLHHPMRGVYPLTYEANAATGTMHGFLNVLLAAAFAWHGRHEIEPILNETKPGAFRFDEAAHWRDWSLSTGQIREARQQFVHAIGSCSFDEPVQGLQALGLL